MKKLFLYFIILPSLFFITGCYDDNSSGGNAVTAGLSCSNVTDYLSFDTYSTVRVCFNDNDSDLRVSTIKSHIKSTLTLYNRLADPYNSYPGMTNIYTINQDPSSTHTIDEELFYLIKDSIEAYELTNGVVNIALDPVVNIWKEYTDCHVNTTACDWGLPSDSELQTANSYSNIDDIILDEENFTITMQENMSISMGAMVKGYVARELQEYFKTVNIAYYMINLGSSTLGFGYNPSETRDYWNIALEDPNGTVGCTDYPYSCYTTVSLEINDSLSTSGSYDRYFEYNGDEYHHIIDPETLYPALGFSSISVISDDAFLNDVLTTALFIMDIETGKAFIEGLDGFEASWYTTDNQIIYSSGFSNYQST